MKNGLSEITKEKKQKHFLKESYINKFTIFDSEQNIKLETDEPLKQWKRIYEEIKKRDKNFYSKFKK